MTIRPTLVDADERGVEEQFVELLEHYRGEPGSLEPLLQGAQAIFGYLPEEVMRRVADAAGEPLSKALGVATSYAQFRLKPHAKHTIRCCHGTACHVGSFFIIRKSTYDDVGTHEAVRHEIIEDGALGEKVKEDGFKMKMVRGDHLIDAVWARGLSTLWNGLKRLMIPLFLQNGKIAIGIFFAVLFLLFMPYVFLAYSAPFAASSGSFFAVFVSSTVSSALLFSACVVDALALRIKMRHAICAPLGSLVVVCGFLAGLLQAKSNKAVSWRGRS